MAMQSRAKYFTSQCTGARQQTTSLEGGSTRDSSSRSAVMNEAGEEVFSLHQKLQLETENIIRWKASTEVNTKQLQLQLDESQGTITDLRRNLMELQLTNENLSQNLIREREERNLVNGKVMHTRKMISSIQQQCQELESTVSILHQEKEYHSAVQNNTIENMDVLGRNFKDLSLLSEEKLKSISNKAQEDIMCLEDKRLNAENRLKIKITENTDLRKKLNEHKEEISDLTERLNNASTLAKETEEKYGQIKVKLDEVQDTLSNTLCDLEIQVSENTQVKKELKEEQYKLKESKSEFREAVDKIKFLKNSNDILEGTNSELTEKLEAISSLKMELEKEANQKGQIIERLQKDHCKLLAQLEKVNCSINNLSLELNTKEENCCTLLKENNNLLMQVEISNKQLAERESTIKQIQEELSVTTKKLEDDQVVMNGLKEELQSNEEIKLNLQHELHEKEAEIQTKDAEISSALQKIGDSTLNEKALNETILLLQNQLDKMREDMEQQIQTLNEDKKSSLSEFAEAEASLKDRLQHLEKEIQEERLKFENEKNSLLNSLREKDSSADCLKQELTDKIVELDRQLNRAKQDLSSQADYTRKEMDELKAKAASEECCLNEKLATTEDDYQKASERVAALQIKNENLTKELKTMKSHVKEQEKDVKVKGKKIQQEEKKVEKLEQSLTNLQSNILMVQEKNKELEEECLKLKNDWKEFEQIQIKNQEKFEEERKVLEAELQNEKGRRECLEIEQKDKRQEFVSFQDSVNDKMQKTNEQMQKLITDHKAQIDVLESEKEKVIQEKLEIEKETLQKIHMVEAETDEKIRMMADFLERYRSEYAAKLAEAELQIKDLQSTSQGNNSVERLSKVRKLSTITAESPHQHSANRTPLSSPYVGAVTTPTQDRSVNHRLLPKTSKVSRAQTEVHYNTPSPSQYLEEETFVFREPQIPKISQKSSGQNRFNNVMGNKEWAGILKNKRTLLPSSSKKQVVFKLPSPCINSGDSSSDACTIEVIDSDDVFDEVLNSGNYKSILKPKSTVKPQANVPPMRHSSVSNEESEDRSHLAAIGHMPLSQNAYSRTAIKKTESCHQEKKRKKEIRTYSVKKSPGRENLTPPSKQ